jgi:hypothetical protein
MAEEQQLKIAALEYHELPTPVRRTVNITALAVVDTGAQRDRTWPAG